MKCLTQNQTEMVTFVYRNEKTFKDQLKEMNLIGVGWRDKEMIIRIKEQKQKDEEYQRQKQARYHKYILKKPTQS